MYDYYGYRGQPGYHSSMSAYSMPHYGGGQQVMLMPYPVDMGYYSHVMSQHYHDGYAGSPRGGANGYRAGAKGGKQQRDALFSVDMSAAEMFDSLRGHFDVDIAPRVSWLNRMLTKCTTPEDFDRAAELLRLYKTKQVKMSSETGTLFIKAACRAGSQEKALRLLNMDAYKIVPTLGGMHYLMISFSLNQQTSSVLQTFETIKNLVLKPNARTYHILIRECVDKGLIERALEYADHCRQSGMVPNRVTYNILMNGCRKLNLPERMLQFRNEMTAHGIEINDSTCKFVAIAHMMTGDLEAAVRAFLEYPEREAKLNEYCNKFLEVASEGQKDLVIQLFTALKERGVHLPAKIEAHLGDGELEPPTTSRTASPFDASNEFNWLLDMIDDPDEPNNGKPGAKKGGGLKNAKKDDLAQLMQQWSANQQHL